MFFFFIIRRNNVKVCSLNNKRDKGLGDLLVNKSMSFICLEKGKGKELIAKLMRSGYMTI